MVTRSLLHTALRTQTWPSRRWPYRRYGSASSTSASRSCSSESASWSNGLRSRNRECSRSWIRSTATSGSASCFRTSASVSCCFSSVASVRPSGRSRTARTGRASPTTSTSTTVFGSRWRRCCVRAATSHRGWSPHLAPGRLYTPFKPRASTNIFCRRKASVVLRKIAES